MRIRNARRRCFDLGCHRALEEEMCIYEYADFFSFCNLLEGASGLGARALFHVRVGLVFEYLKGYTIEVMKFGFCRHKGSRV